VILTQYYFPEKGAPQTRLKELVAGLSKSGWEVMVVTAMPNYPTGKIFKSYAGKLFSGELVDNISIHRHWLFASNSKRALPRVLSMFSFSVTCLFSLFRVRKHKPSYIFTESPPLLLGLSGLVLARLSGAKHIMNVSDIWPLSAFELGVIGKGFVFKSLERLERFLYKKSFALIGQSDEIVRHLAQVGHNRCLLFRNGVDISRFIEWKPRKRSSNPKIKFVYAGLLGVAQGIYDLSRNIDLHELNAEFHIYGDGSERKLIESYLNAKPPNNIVIHPPVDSTGIPKLLTQYDVAIVPLRKPIYGAVPSKIYEAMAAGLPILFSGGGEGASLIQKYDLGWICPSSDYKCMNSLIRHIVLSMHSDELQLMSQRCRNAAESIFERSIQIANVDRFLSDSLTH
jgi:glycosyltransferase involved in cell wall biosynthesis